MTRGSWFDGTVLCERNQPENNSNCRESSTLRTPYNVSSRSSTSSIPELCPAASGLRNRTELDNLVTHHARASRVKAARSAPYYPSVAHKSTKWKAMVVVPHPIVLSCRSWQSAQRTWIPSASALSIWPTFKERTLLPYRTVRTRSKSVRSKGRCTSSVGLDDAGRCHWRFVA